ncbi:MAG: hypothetical protein ACJ8CR_31810 [Roseiflexaceae bacterium]
MLLKRRLHFTEAAALFSVQVDMYTRDNTEAARSWLEMWADVDPDNPLIAHRRQALAPGGGLKRLLGRRK